MSLADQSQQWFPTSVQVTVHQARNLRPKGKNGTNDAYAIMQVAKDKFSTSVSEKCLDPVWKEEASFDLPLFHPGNGDRCTLYIIVMHRAHVGLDKFLGQAVVNLLEQHDNNPRKKTEWFKLVDKSGKEDKARGEVLLDIQFLRNNMSASMIDLSMQDKPRSRMSKLKDKVRGKKKDGFSDSASAIVPSVSNVLTDSEGEADAQSITSHQSEGVKKKSKLKTLFAPKSNLQRNISQSMSTLGTLPEKNSSLSGSRSSGLNVDSPEGKKKFKFRGHKRTGSSDSKVSLGAFSLLGRSKQKDIDKTCINGNHVYAEKKEPVEDTLSLNSSGQGSVEDVRKYKEVGVDVPSYQHETTDRAVLEQQHHQEDEEEKRKQAEEWRIAESKRLEEEEKHRVEVQRLREEDERRQQEEQERKRRFLEDEARREEERRKQEEAAGNHRLEEERRRAEEQKQQEEASMSDRLSSLFGMIRKKEEKKEELPVTAPFSDSGDPDELISPRSSNPFEDIPLSSDPPVSSDESPADDQKFSRKPQMPSALAFLNRSAKVSAVKPRFTQSLESEPADCQTPSQLYPSPAESTLSSVPSESPDTFSSLHSSLAPAITIQSPSGSPRGSIEDLSSAGSSPTMSDKRRRAPTPPSYGTPNGVPVNEATSPTSVEIDGPTPGRKLSLPLPDYETLFPQKRHGVQGETRWDHIIAEVNQKNRDSAEMSVDGPEELAPSRRTSSLQQESPDMKQYQTQPQETKPISSKTFAAPAPPNSVTPPYLRSAADFFQSSSRDSLSGMSRNGARKALLPPAATQTPRLINQMDLDTTPRNDHRDITVNKDAPTARPRQKAGGKEPAQQEDSAVTPDKYMNSYMQTSGLSSMDTKGRQAKENFDFDPFPSTELLTKDPWAQLKPNKEADDFFTGGVQKEQKVEDRGMTPGDLDSIFGQEKQTDPFADFNGKNIEYMKKDEDSKQVSPVIQKINSQRRKPNLSSTTPSDNTTSKSRQEPETTITTAYKGLSARGGRNENTGNENTGTRTPKPPADAKTQSNFYGGEDQFGAEPFTPSVTFAEPLQVVIEEVEPAPLAGDLSGGKSPLRAWVSPTDVVSAQSSNGGGLAFTPRRPHPVKPMNTDNQYPISPPGVKEIKVRERTPGKTQVADSVETGPFTQLTQEELITLVVRQQADLSNKDSKIVELEEYIDNLLVRVIDEQPGILQALTLKPE